MRVLMFGWEFPPHIAGGLGTACYGLTRGLARNDVKVTFVVPRAYGDEDQRFTNIVNASDVETDFCRRDEYTKEVWENLSYITIDSNMVPYATPEEYFERREEWLKQRETGVIQDSWQQRYTFSGKYGANLMEEVQRYAMVAAEVAKAEEGNFDVIHAHD